LITAGQWHEGDPEIWIIGDSGYDGPRLALLLADLPVRILVRLCSDRVLRFPPPPRQPGVRGRPTRHGARFTFADPTSWPTPAQATTTDTTRYGTAHARSWDRLHTKLTRVGAWAGHEELLPIIEGTVIRVQVQRLPGTGTPKPLWLWYSATATTAEEVDRLWQMFLRRFDVEHTLCATRRLVISPAQRGGNRKEVPGSDDLPGAERLRGQQHVRKPVAGSRRMGRRAGGPARYGESLIA
jgi:hypothetical protein